MPAQSSRRKVTVNKPPKLIVGLRKSKANVKGNNPKDRYGLAKVPFSLIPQTAKVFMALGLGEGARKYGPYNWRKEPIQSRIYLEAAERHLNLLLDGEDFDRDTGLHHGAFVLSTIAIYLDAMVQGTLIDNRPICGRTGDLVAYFNRKPGEERTKLELTEGFVKMYPHHFEVQKPTTKGARDRVSVKNLSAHGANFGTLETSTITKGKRNARR